MDRHRRTVSVVALVVALVGVLVLATMSPAEAQGEPIGDWELILPERSVLELVAPASGALFARTSDGARETLARGDDGGVTWSPVPLPPPSSFSAGGVTVAIDPTAHWVMYAGGEEGVYKTVDDGTTWALILPARRSELERARRVAVSPANPTLVYVGFLYGSDDKAHFRFLRSRDGGATWEQLQDNPRTQGCWWDTSIFDPHPTDANRMFWTVSCYHRPVEATLQHSTNQGATWSPGDGPSANELGRPSELVGGRGAAPSRFYLLSQRRRLVTAVRVEDVGSSLFRSDDDGLTWTELLAVSAETGGDISALAYDPSFPDRVYLGRESGGGEVQVSRDGGATWATLGRRDLGHITSLALGVDGRNLYAGTVRGVWRLSLGEP